MDSTTRRNNLMNKTIYSIDPGTLGQAKTVPENYRINPIFETEVVPPTNALSLAWDNKTNSWYDSGTNTEIRLTNIELATVENYEMIAAIMERLERLEEQNNG